MGKSRKYPFLYSEGSTPQVASSHSAGKGEYFGIPKEWEVILKA